MARILIVEDEELLRELLVDHLEGEGHETAEAGDGREGLARYAAFKPDLVISDINMPVMDGFEFLKNLQEQHPDVEDTPFFFLSALSDSQTQVKGFDFGVDEYLCKPVDFDVLNAKIGLVLKRQQKIKRMIKAAWVASNAAPKTNGAAATPTASPAEPTDPARPSATPQINPLMGRHARLGPKEKEKILSLVTSNDISSSIIINKLGRRLNMSRTFINKEKSNYINLSMISSEFDAAFFTKVNHGIFRYINIFLASLHSFKDHALVVPTFFRFLYEADLRDQYLENIEQLQERYSVTVISETINIPDRFATYADALKPLSRRNQVQIIEVRKPEQIKDLNLEALNVGAISMDYADAIKLDAATRADFKSLLASRSLNFYIKEIPEGKIKNAQALEADLLSVAY